VSGNIVTNSPVSGIRIGSSAGGTAAPVQRVRITENTIVDAGNAGIPSTNPDYVYRHAIGLFGFVKEVDIMRNMINDTKSDTAATYGYYALYLNQASSSANIRTSQNTVRVGAPASQTGQPTVLPTFQGPNSGGLVDATNANDVQVLPSFTGGTQTATQLPVDFMSFTRYITTIGGQSGSQLLVNVQSPPVDPGGAYVQWTVGQLVTFRFRCGNLQVGGCFVTFDAAYSGVCETGDTVNCNTAPVTSLVIPSSLPTGPTGRAITFAVESLGATHRFFELYRSPTGVPN